jgi:hypothetical protein
MLTDKISQEGIMDWDNIDESTWMPINEKSEEVDWDDSLASKFAEGGQINRIYKNKSFKELWNEIVPILGDTSVFYESELDAIKLNSKKSDNKLESKKSEEPKQKIEQKNIRKLNLID